MKRYSMEEKAEILKEVENLGNINLVCRKRGISHTTVHNWIKKGVIDNSRNYPAENRRLKKRISELELQNSILKDLLKKNSPNFLERKATAKLYINAGHGKSLVLRTCELSRSGYYKFCKASSLVQVKENKQSIRTGRPFPGYSLDLQGKPGT